VAVDNLVEGLVSAGVKALRVGSGGNVRSSLMEHTLDHKLETHSLQPSLARLVKREEELSARMVDLEARLGGVRRKELDGAKGLTKRGDNMQLSLLNMQNEQHALKSRIYAMQQQMLRNVISDADAVCEVMAPSEEISLSTLFFVDLHDMHYIRMRSFERDRLSCRVPG
jgi:AAA domain